MSDIGTQENPYTHAPPDWKVNGVPYGAYCRCVKCGFVARSTFTFDYYAKEPGDPLTCEHCTLGRSYSVAEVTNAIADNDNDVGSEA